MKSSSCLYIYLCLGFTVTFFFGFCWILINLNLDDTCMPNVSNFLVQNSTETKERIFTSFVKPFSCHV